MSKQHDIIELLCEYVTETDSALCVTNLKDENVWLPKSVIQIDSSPKAIARTGVVDIQIPEKWAYDKGLI